MVFIKGSVLINKKNARHEEFDYHFCFTRYLTVYFEINMNDKFTRFILPQFISLFIFYGLLFKDLVDFMHQFMNVILSGHKIYFFKHLIPTKAGVPLARKGLKKGGARVKRRG